MAVMLLAMCHMAMADGHMRYNCLANWNGPLGPRAGSRIGQNDIAYGDMGWDAERTYHQLVVLVSFVDCDFTMEDPKATYDAIFNEPGYNQGVGAGCVADYFRDQSAGLMNLQFDVFGPIKVSSSVKTGSAGGNNGQAVFEEAMRSLIETYPDLDYSLYDWDSDGSLEPVVFVYAGYCGNQSSIKDEGYIWPNTGGCNTIKTPDGYLMFTYTASGELWTNDTLHGIGTICHEYSHCLGLPDIYPTSKAVSDFSIVDEWDLMDGGTATNYGWCPPNYSPLEKMIMGWLTPSELTADTTVTSLRPLADGGEAFLIQHVDDDAFYLVENRQWNSWDYGVPGYGLVVYRVNFNKVYWQINYVNNVQGQPDYCLQAADGRTFTDWYNLLVESGARTLYNDPERRLHSKILSGAPYPWQDEETSVSQVTLFDIISLSDIVLHEDGTVSFAFHGLGNAIRNVKKETKATGVYTLSGVKVRDDGQTEGLPKGVYIVGGRKVVE